MRPLLLIGVVLVGACNSPRKQTTLLTAEGEPCMQDKECESSLCFALKGEGKKCGRQCASGCEETQVCTQLGFQRYGCVPKKASLCSPCETSADCAYAADSCINVAGHLVCGQDCSFDSNCPEGYRCGVARDYMGNETGSQCIPKSATCDCTPEGSGMRLSCQKTSDAGTCVGVRICNGSEYSACSAKIPSVETCNGIDDDCDDQVDEDLGNVTCGVGACQRKVNNCTEGAAQTCTPGSPTAETCNEIDDNCDGTVDEGFDKTTPQHCGSCANVCTVSNGTAACAADGGVCSIASCNAPYADCSAGYVDGCETNTSNNVNHCGMCGRVCKAANATSNCTGGACGFTCLPNFADLNKNPDDGCEFGCDKVNPDLPDLAFGDSNCDGIDGDATRAIFVDGMSGNDANSGTKASPKKTILGGIAAAEAANPKKSVYVSMGTYNEAVVLRSGVSLYGGYNAASNWSRANSFVTRIASPTTMGVSGIDLNLPTEVQLFTIDSAQASSTEANGDGKSSYGVHLFNSQAVVTLRGLNVNPGSGSEGATGATPAKAASGMKGGDAVQKTPGTAGSSSCGAPGGNGGAGKGGVETGEPGSAGTQASGGGTAGPAGTGGAAGFCDTTGSQDGNPAPLVSAAGAGAGGLAGTPGAQIGKFSSQGLFTPAAGGSGSNGLPGGGGGGGGGGGSTAHGHTNDICTGCTSHWSGGGGGGGGGGCGGQLGVGGRGGGGSFGIFITGTSPVIENTRVSPGNGGRGGAGGAGGEGGSGGLPGKGASGECHQEICSTRCGGRGADGAAGGAGGQGGGGAGGTGGPSVCVVYQGGVPELGGVTCNLGLPGEGGQGGLGGTARAPNGTGGITAASLRAM